MYVPDPGLKFKLEQLLYDTGELYLDLKVCKLIHYHMLCYRSERNKGRFEGLHAGEMCAFCRYIYARTRPI